MADREEIDTRDGEDEHQKNVSYASYFCVRAQGGISGLRAAAPDQRAVLYDRDDRLSGGVMACAGANT